MKYIEIDFNKVKGFNELTPEQQGLFIRTYKRHNSCHGTDYKEDYIPISVEWVEGDFYMYGYLRVMFRNREWLHYTRKGEWY